LKGVSHKDKRKEKKEAYGNRGRKPEGGGREPLPHFNPGSGVSAGADIKYELRTGDKWGRRKKNARRQLRGTKRKWGASNRETCA